MLTPSNVQTYEFNNAIKADSKTHIKITATDGSDTYTLTDDDVHSSGLSMRFFLNGDTDLTIGKAVTREVSFKLIRTANVQDAVLHNGFNVEIGVDILYASGQLYKTGWVNLGKFYPIDDDNFYDNDVKDIVSYDCMNKFDIPADEWLQGLTYPLTVEQMFTSLCNYVGVTGEIGNALTNMKARSFSTAPIVNMGLMCRDVLELIAEACGCYARITPDEHCKLVWFNLTNWTLSNNDIFERGIKQYISQVSGVNVRNTEDDIGVLYPSTADPDNLYVIVDNPFLVTANSTEETNYIAPLYNRLKQYNHHPFTLTCIGNPLIEAGDIVYAYPSSDAANPVFFPVYVKEMLWNGACTDMYQSTGNRTRNVYNSAVKQKLSVGGKYHIFKNDIDQLYSEIADAEDSITIVDQKADNIALSAGKKARMWYSNTAPTGTTSEPLVANVDYWINTSDNRKLMRWTGNAWAAADDISKYTKYSGIDINQNGVDITGSKYVKIQSGGSFLVDATNFKIDSANKLLKSGNWQFDDTGLCFKYNTDDEFRIIGGSSISGYPNLKAGIRVGSYDDVHIIVPDIDGTPVEFGFYTRYPVVGVSGGVSLVAPRNVDTYLEDFARVQSDQVISPHIAPTYVDHHDYERPSYSATKGSVGNELCPFKEGNFRDVYVDKIKFIGTKSTGTMIQFLDNTADAYGNGLMLGDGGVVIIGAGESASQVYTYSGATASTETLFLASDYDVKILSNVQDGYANRKEFVFGSNGNFTAPGNVNAQHFYKNGTELNPNTWRGFQTKQYQYTYTIAANSSLQIPASSFLGNSAPSGYTPVAISYFNTSDSNVEVFYLDATATGSAAMVVLQNRANAQISHPMAIKILYLQN